MMRGPCTGQAMGIPREVRASVAVAQENRFRGEFATGAAQRLRELVGAEALRAPLQVDLQADARSGWPRLHGSISGTIGLECRRCGKQYAQPVQIELDLRLVRSEAEERSLLSDVDPYWVQDDRLPLHELIEEEVLLALPMLPRCESCENATQAAPQLPATEETVKRENPFAALKQKLKTNRE